MFLPAGQLTIGPAHCAWRAYRHGTPAEPLVRAWLAERLHCDADRLPIARSPHGRPSLEAPHAGFDVSWSHSGEGLLMALGEGVRLGIDLEFLRPRPKMQTLAERFFAAAEAEALADMPAARREHAFVRLWCAKEAVLKAHGQGLSFGLHRLRFEPRGEAWTLVECDPALGAPMAWTVHAFAPAPHYLATVAWHAA